MPIDVKAVISDAFIKLSKEKNVDKITVKDVVEECNISRQTFYYHFRDILDVLEWSTEREFQDLLKRSLETDDTEEVLLDFLTASEDSHVLLQKLLHSQRREQIEQLMVRSVRTYLRGVVDKKGARTNLQYDDTVVMLDFCAYGIVGLVFESCTKKDVDRKKLAKQMHRLISERLDKNEET